MRDKSWQAFSGSSARRAIGSWESLTNQRRWYYLYYMTTCPLAFFKLVMMQPAAATAFCSDSWLLRKRLGPTKRLAAFGKTKTKSEHVVLVALDANTVLLLAANEACFVRGHHCWCILVECCCYGCSKMQHWAWDNNENDVVVAVVDEGARWWRWVTRESKLTTALLLLPIGNIFNLLVLWTTSSKQGKHT